MTRLVCRSVWVAVVCLCLLFGGSGAAAESPHTAFFQANTLYSQGDYARAIHAYERCWPLANIAGMCISTWATPISRMVRSAGRS